MRDPQRNNPGSTRWKRFWRSVGRRRRGHGVNRAMAAARRARPRQACSSVPFVDAVAVKDGARHAAATPALPGPSSQGVTRTRRRVVPDTALSPSKQGDGDSTSPRRRGTGGDRPSRRLTPGSTPAKASRRPLSQRPDTDTARPAGRATRVHPLLWPGLDRVRSSLWRSPDGAVLLSAAACVIILAFRVGDRWSPPGAVSPAGRRPGAHRPLATASPAEQEHHDGR